MDIDARVELAADQLLAYQTSLKKVEHWSDSFHAIMKAKSAELGREYEVDPNLICGYICLPSYH